MTQNGPNPGQPSQPWSAGGGEQPYREPADPWGDQPDAHHHAGDLNTGWGGNPTSMPPGAAGTSSGYAGYPPTGTYSSAPLDSAHDSAPLDSPPLGSAPLGSAPLDSPPLGSAPLGSAPLGSAPLDSAPLDSAPLGSAPTWAEPTAAPARRGPGVPIIALVGVLGVLICGGLGTMAWLLSRGTPTDTPTGRAVTPTTVQSPAGVEPAPRSSEDVRFVVKGQCVRNDGTAVKPEMTITQCAAGTYQVLARVDKPTTGEADAEAKCAKYKNYTKWYFYDSELDSLDFVLCLRER